MNKYVLMIVMILPLLMSSEAFSEDLHFYTLTGETIIPDSSIPKHDGSVHTFLIARKPFKRITQGMAAGLPDGETPASAACIYGLTTPVSGCKKETATELPSGGWGTIAIVDAFYYPDIETDLNTFSAQFGLPACTIANGCFQIVYATQSGNPPAKQGWQKEQSLDVEWAHAMAPNAKIILVEAETGDPSDIYPAVRTAANLVAAAGGGIVSNSWGRTETADEITFDSSFIKDSVVFFASSGDDAAPGHYPGASPNVVSAGGTTIERDAQGNFTGESAWSKKIEDTGPSGGGGGPSAYESRPAYQNLVQKIVGTQRGKPDISFDANPDSGVLVYSTFAGGWIVEGGTSVSSPALAGIINTANRRASSTAAELNYIYSQYAKRGASNWRDIITGNNGYPAMKGYDFATGIGSPIGYQGK